MRNAIFLLVIFMFVSCKKETEETLGKSETETTTSTTTQTPEELGKELFSGKGACVACHHPNEKIIGPSLKSIAKIYLEKNGNMISFLKGEREPIVDPSQYEIMKASLDITKTFSAEELKAVEAYIYSTLN
jgi:cytochrome c